jgi:hypothetical protein
MSLITWSPLSDHMLKVTNICLLLCQIMVYMYDYHYHESVLFDHSKCCCFSMTRSIRFYILMYCLRKHHVSIIFVNSSWKNVCDSVLFFVFVCLVGWLFFFFHFLMFQYYSVHRFCFNFRKCVVIFFFCESKQNAWHSFVLCPSCFICDILHVSSVWLFFTHC